MQEPPPVETLLDALEGFARDVERILAGSNTVWHDTREPGEWSLTEVVCHLRDVELEVHQPRLEALVGEDGAFLPGAVADEWVQERNYQSQNGRQALEAFLAARMDTLLFLRGLDPSMMQRQGQHAFFGPTTMHELLYLMVQHDEAHWEQISALLGP